MEEKLFKKVLIANRGEIALRIMRACQSLGIRSVAVYSEADIHSVHALRAEEAVCVGPAPSLQSYLNIERMIDVARRTGADAIHPGYGFLSENAEFAQACQSAGITFIGPSVDSIRRMGSKAIAKKLAIDNGVPVVPGYEGENQSAEILGASALAIGLPVLIKASAGGGGRGMRIVRTPDDLAASIESARREAEKSFGDGTLLIERLIDRARHIEVQIFGDHHGNLVHLFERDCSAQRRHQKIIEETPSPAVNPDLRARITEAALTIGRAIGYYNAGTVEFVLAPSGEFFFIEVNTRLQVEHPVTEMVTAQDLVQLQIEVARGCPLPFTQREIRSTGHAIEARIYAEDPSNDFLPSTGKILDWEYVHSFAGMRVESGVEAGSDVSIHYDPMLAKIIVRGSDRKSAIHRLTAVLRSLSALGVKTNRDFLIRLLDHPDFLAGSVDTAFIDRRIDELTLPADPAAFKDAAVAVALYREQIERSRRSRVPAASLHFRNNPYGHPSTKLDIGGERVEVSYHETTSNSYFVQCGDWQAQCRVVSFKPGIIRLEIEGVQRSFRIVQSGQTFWVYSTAGSFEVKWVSRHPDRARHSEQESANSPMPGQVLEILVSEGQRVSSGDALVVLEAMKMEQTLRANSAGVIEAVLVKRGDLVAPGDELVRITAQAD